MSEYEPAAKAADEVRDELMSLGNPRHYNQGVDDAVEKMKEWWEAIEDE